MLASGGYPKSYQKGYEISSIEDISNETHIFHAGTKNEKGRILTNGGRVLNVVSKGKTLDETIKNVYSEVKKIKFKDVYFRKDIGKRKP